MIEQPLIDHASTADIGPGDVFKIAHPFVREDFNGPDGLVKTWKPGTRQETPDDVNFFTIADGEGLQVLTVVSLHRPGSYPTRVFYTRKWIDPSGGEFGKRDLHCKGVSAFRQIIKGYRWPYEVEPIEAKGAAQ